MKTVISLLAYVVLAADMAKGMLPVNGTVSAFGVTGQTVPGEWIASVNGVDADCENVKAQILAVKKKSLGINSADKSRKLSIHTACFISFDGDEALVAQVKKMKKVKYVHQNQYVQVQANPPSWGLNRIDQTNLPLSSGLPFSTSFTGAGVNIYIIDTGININHVDFGGRAQYGADFINESSQGDMNGHGSHCAGTAAGTSYGIARDAKLYAVKVLSGAGSGTSTGVISGIQWAVNNQKNNFQGASAVLSMSLGGGATLL